MAKNPKCTVNFFVLPYLIILVQKSEWMVKALADLGGREGRMPPPGRPNSFDFMQFSGKFGVFTPPLEGSRPPLGKILDPPLQIEYKTDQVGSTHCLQSRICDLWTGALCPHRHQLWLRSPCQPRDCCSSAPLCDRYFRGAISHSVK